MDSAAVCGGGGAAAAAAIGAAKVALRLWDSRVEGNKDCPVLNGDEQDRPTYKQQVGLHISHNGMSNKLVRRDAHRQAASQMDARRVQRHGFFTNEMVQFEVKSGVRACSLSRDSLDKPSQNCLGSCLLQLSSSFAVATAADH